MYIYIEDDLGVWYIILYMLTHEAVYGHFDRLKWMRPLKSLIVKLRCISMKVYEMYGPIIEYEIHDVFMSELL